jgi:hypothetical protein
LTSVTRRRGTCAIAVALPSRKRPWVIVTLPEMVPPLPAERISRSPVTDAAMSSRSSNRAFCARTLKLIPPAADRACPSPEIRPPSAVVPWNCSIRSCEPPNRPKDWRFSITMPVTALSSRAPTVRTEPLIRGFSRLPAMSAAIAAGPETSISSTPVSRQSVSAGPL